MFFYLPNGILSNKFIFASVFYFFMLLAKFRHQNKLNYLVLNYLLFPFIFIIDFYAFNNPYQDSVINQHKEPKLI